MVNNISHEGNNFDSPTDITNELTKQFSYTNNLEN